MYSCPLLLHMSRVCQQLQPAKVTRILSPSRKLSQVTRMTISTNNQVKVNVGGIMINTEKAGIGPHPIICLPGALGSIDSDFRPQLCSLNDAKFTIVAWDPPGYGRSRPPERDFSGGAQMFYRDAKMAEMLMRELKLENFSILGWSDGGITAMILAALFPDSVRKLVIWGANAFISEKDMEIYKSVEDVDKWSAKMKAPMVELYGEEVFRELWTGWMKMCRQIHDSGGDICKGELEKIKCPTLIIHGRDDPMVGIEHPTYLHEHIKNSKLTLMDGKHNVHLRHFIKFDKLVQEFLLQEE